MCLLLVALSAFVQMLVGPDHISLDRLSCRLPLCTRSILPGKGTSKEGLSIQTRLYMEATQVRVIYLKPGHPDASGRLQQL